MERSASGGGPAGGAGGSEELRLAGLSLGDASPTADPSFSTPLRSQPQPRQVGTAALGGAVLQLGRRALPGQAGGGGGSLVATLLRIQGADGSAIPKVNLAPVGCAGWAAGATAQVASGSCPALPAAAALGWR